MQNKIKALIEEAEHLKGVEPDSPRVDLWERRAKKFVKENFGDEFVDMLSNALSWGSVITRGEGPAYHHKAMDKAIVLLDSLKNEELNDDTEDLAVEVSLLGLHKVIVSKCISLFDKEEYAESVEKGFKTVRDKLRVLTGHERGSDAFGAGGLHIKGASAPHVDDDFNQAVKFLMMAIDMFRNEKSHTSDGRIEDRQRAYEYLCLCSLAMRFLDQSEIKK